MKTQKAQEIPKERNLIHSDEDEIDGCDFTKEDVDSDITLDEDLPEAEGGVM